MQAGIDTTVHDMDWIVGMIDAAAPKPNRAGRYNQPKAIAGDDYLNKGVTVEMADRHKPRG
jgi:hypothetical protein